MPLGYGVATLTLTLPAHDGTIGRQILGMLYYSDSVSSAHSVLELAQTHVCWVGDALQLSHPLLSPSPPAFSLSQFTSVQFSLSVMSDSLRPHELQHTRPPCLSLTPGIYSTSCPLSRWCHPTISSSVVPFSSCLQSFPASGSFPMSQPFASGGQSIGVQLILINTLI